MPFIPLNLDEVTEAKPVIKGDYELQITGAKVTETGENSKHPGSPMIKITLGFTDPEIDAPTIQHYMTFPVEGDENAKLKNRMIKRFLAAFQVPYSPEGLDLDNLANEMLGHTATVGVGQQPPNENGDIFNNLNLPRLRDEEIAKPSGGRGRKSR